MIHLTAGYATDPYLGGRKLQGACGDTISGEDNIKFDDIHRTDKTLTCQGCIEKALERLKQRRTDLAINAVAIHNKQIVVSELIERYSNEIYGDND